MPLPKRIPKKATAPVRKKKFKITIEIGGNPHNTRTIYTDRPISTKPVKRKLKE